MSILRSVLATLWGMFLGDIRLTAAILAVVIMAAIAADWAAMPLVGAVLLLAGSLGVLVASVISAARR